MCWTHEQMNIGLGTSTHHRDYAQIDLTASCHCFQTTRGRHPLTSSVRTAEIPFSSAMLQCPCGEGCAYFLGPKSPVPMYLHFSILSQPI